MSDVRIKIWNGVTARKTKRVMHRVGTTPGVIHVLKLQGDITIEVDFDRLYHMLAAKALKSAGKMATEASGAIKVRARHVKVVSEWDEDNTGSQLSPSQQAAGVEEPTKP